MSDTRLLIISGKGGVGKTTIAAATGVAAAHKGNRTLVVSLDRAHNLGEVLRCELGSSPVYVSVVDGLQAMEIDSQAELSNNWPVLKTFVSEFLTYLGMGGVEAEEMAVFPGLEELLVLTRLMELVESNQYDLVIADMAPTASSLRYLSFPDMMEGVLGKLVTWDQRMAALLRPLQGKVIKMPVPEEEVYDNFRDLAKRLGDLRKMLGDSSRTAVRLVMTPEKIVLEETRRALTYLSLFGLTVDSVVINRLLPREALQGYLHSWGEIQEQIVELAREGFGDLPIETLYFQPQEVLGADRLLKTADDLYGEKDPAIFQRDKSPFTYEKEGEVTILSIHLPNACGNSLDLRRRGQDLILTVDGWRRVILLPDFLSEHTVSKARLSKGFLRVCFSAPLQAK